MTMTIPSQHVAPENEPGNKLEYTCEGKRTGPIRLAIMGEFSSGKSTLTNLLLGAAPLPTKVTATRLPPVWISRGDGPNYYEDYNGKHVPFEIQEILTINLDDTIVVRLFLNADILDLCDIIDMPGISDPNMPADVWSSLMDEVDCVIWCTPANQSWRQSEAAVWASLPKELYTKSLLLVTHRDKMQNEADLKKVLKRVRAETSGLFSEVHSISVTQALAADEEDEWERSGANAFVNALVDIISSHADNAFSRISTDNRRLETASFIDMSKPDKRAALTSPYFTVIRKDQQVRTPRPPKEDKLVPFQDILFE